MINVRVGGAVGVCDDLFSKVLISSINSDPTCACVSRGKFECTLAVDSSFQTLVVDFSSNL